MKHFVAEKEEQQFLRSTEAQGKAIFQSNILKMEVLGS